MPAPRVTLPGIEKPLLACLGFFLLVFAARLFWIHQYGNATPYWEQWDSEAASPFKPWLEGNLPWSRLFDQHNEHRIFTFRVLVLLELELNHRIWNPLLEMVVSACLYAATMAGVLALGMRLCRREMWPLLLLGMLLLCSIPFDYDNILGGFQAQFYLLLLFSLLFLRAMASATLFSRAWWAGMVAGGLAIFSMGSGIVAPLAVVGLYLLQGLLRVRRDRGSLITAAALLLVAAVVIHNMSAFGFNVEQPHSLDDVLYSASLVMTWPFLPFVPGLFLLVNLPYLLFAAGLAKEAPPPEDRRWLLLLCGLWVILQWSALVDARGAVPLLSRYKTVLLMGPVVNLLCLVALPGPSGWRSWVRARLILVWPVFMVLGLVIASGGVQRGMEDRHRDSLVQQERLLPYLTQGKPLQVDDLPDFVRPYPSSSRLKGFLDDPTIHDLLPPNILPSHEARQVWWVRLLLPRLQACAIMLALAGTGLLLLFCRVCAPLPGRRAVASTNISP